MAEEAGEGAGDLEGKVGQAGEEVDLGGTGDEVAREGKEGAQDGAGAGDLVVEGEVAGAGDEVGELVGAEGRGVVAVGGAILVATGARRLE